MTILPHFTDLLIAAVAVLLAGLIGLLPSDPFSALAGDISSTWASVAGPMAIANHFVDVGLIVTCVTAVFTLRAGRVGFRLLNWALSHIPWIGGR